MARTVLAILLASGGAAEAAAQEGERKDHRFVVTWGVETWEADLDITGSDNNFGATSSEIEEGIDPRVVHTTWLLGGEYEYAGTENLLIRARLGLGQDRLSSTFEIPPNNPELGDGDGTFDWDTAYDAAFVWEFGVGARYAPADQKFDVGVSIAWRAGENDRSDGINEEDYEYTRFTVAVEGGFRALEGVRPFVALRFVTYEADYDFAEKLPAGTDAFSFDLELDRTFGLTLGADLSSGAMIGQVGLLLVDSSGFFASLGWRF